MVFSSVMFLFRFLPVALLIYYVTPRKFKNFVLFVESLIFYSWGEIRYFPIMIFSVVLDYVASNGMEKFSDRKAIKRAFLLLSIFGNMGMLLFFKYTNFFITNINSVFSTNIDLLNITLPLGISFYTFQTMSYSIDVYWGKVKAEKNIVDFSAFVVLFPQLIAGPIVKYTDINTELKERTMNLPQIQEGIETFIWGLGRKVLLANSIGALWTEVEAMNYANISTVLAWLGIIAFALQIYFDFSGYSLMAIGLGKMLGFNFPQNFNHPYISKSATEFWRRWHMTLGSWFREYLYIPLGGNRCGKYRQIFNIFVVWAATGFWHGASWNFVLWGLFFFVLLILEKNFYLGFLEKHKIISRIYIIPLLLISWTLFAITDFTKLGTFFTTMFVPNTSMDWVYYLRNYGFVMLICIVFCTPLIENFIKKLTGKLSVVKYAMLTAVLVLSVAYLVDATYNPFLYFRF